MSNNKGFGGLEIKDLIKFIISLIIESEENIKRNNII